MDEVIIVHLDKLDSGTWNSLMTYAEEEGFTVEDAILNSIQYAMRQHYCN